MPARPATRPRRARAATARRSRLIVEVVEEGPAWTCLDEPSTARIAAKVASALSRHIDLPAATVSAALALADDDRLRELNRQWRNIDKPTNVLSFPASPPPPRPSKTGRAGTRASAHFLGDIIIAEATLAREAADQDIPISDHFHHLVLHGLLHLAGYDHEVDVEAEEMEALETRILADLGIADPYASSVPLERPSMTPAPKRSRTAKQ